MLLDDLLAAMLAMGGSDLHVSEGAPPLVRVDGRLVPVAGAADLDAGRVEELVLDVVPEDLREDFRTVKTVDFSFAWRGRARFRANAFVQKGSPALALRVIPTTVPTMAELGVPEVLDRLVDLPHGLILVTGPTGSGKSTTLYATLNVLNQEGVNIVTTEDPVEYQLAGITQVQTNNKVGLTFATALRSILRQDPDIVLVGEMRDRETAHIGMEAALTGHLVLSTLHTNDAPSAVTRLTEMGIEPFLVGSAVDCVLAQRLARRVCHKCVDMRQPDEVVLKEAGFDDDIIAERPEIPHAVGCSSCSNTGYRGRLAVHEVMTVTEEIERLTVARASSDEIERVAIDQGMRTLREDGLSKVLLGRTTIEEVGRVIV